MDAVPMPSVIANANNEIVFMFFSCLSRFVRDLSAGIGKQITRKECPHASAGGWNVDDQAFRAYREDFAGCADAHRVQIPVPAFLRRSFLPGCFRTLFVSKSQRSYNHNALAVGARLGKGYGGKVSLRLNR